MEVLPHYFNGSIDHLHSRLRETVTGGVPEEVLQEVDEYLREIALMDMGEVHNDDDEIQQPAEGSDHDLNPFDTNHVGVDYATSSTANATTNSGIDDEIDVTGTDSESDNGTESDISINVFFLFFFMDFILEEKCTWLGIEI